MKLPKKLQLRIPNYPSKSRDKNNRKTDKQTKGEQAEQAAIKKLQDNGLTLIERNFYFHQIGEIDAIMQEDDCLVFVEVRCRNSKNLVTPAETINYTKQQKIIKTALYYLQTNNLNHCNCRFDVVCATSEQGLLKLEWIKNAFSA